MSSNRRVFSDSIARVETWVEYAATEFIMSGVPRSLWLGRRGNQTKENEPRNQKQHRKVDRDMDNIVIRLSLRE